MSMGPFFLIHDPFLARHRILHGATRITRGIRLEVAMDEGGSEITSFSSSLFHVLLPFILRRIELALTFFPPSPYECMGNWS